MSVAHSISILIKKVANKQLSDFKEDEKITGERVIFQEKFSEKYC